MRNKQKRGRIYEDELQKEGLGKKQPGSGCTPYAKEDNRSQYNLIQAKSTGTKSHGIKKDDFITLMRNSAALGLIPIYMIDLDGLELAVMTKAQFKYFLSEAEADGIL